MARKKKTVDDTPICDSAYAQQIDPVWTSPKFRRSFWDVRKNRRDYLLWLAHKLGFRTMKDFYQLEFAKVRGKRTFGLSPEKYWDRLAYKAVQDCFPEYDWKPWLFLTAPIRFWDSAANRRTYLEWLGRELGFRQPEDWNRLRGNDIELRGGSSLRQRYTLPDLMREFLPQLDWHQSTAQNSLHIEEILTWADAYHARHAKWPNCASGKIDGTVFTWKQVNDCLVAGRRFLPGGTSLPQLLKQWRGAKIGKRDRELTEEQILAWADAYFATHGKWPNVVSGRIPGTQEKWNAITLALRVGCRGLPGGSSLAQLLRQRRGARNRSSPPPLTEEHILAWADAHFAAHGKWPVIKSGKIPETDESWKGIDYALYCGRRGLRRCGRLSKFLTQRRGLRKRFDSSPLDERKILVWAKAHHKATGQWPGQLSGSIALSPLNKWSAVNQALRGGFRGLPGGSSLNQLLRKHGLK